MDIEKLILAISRKNIVTDNEVRCRELIELLSAREEIEIYKEINKYNSSDLLFAYKELNLGENSKILNDLVIGEYVLENISSSDEIEFDDIY